NTVDEAATDLLSRAFFVGNICLGIDAGATYKIRDNMEVIVSIQDLALMWPRDDVENYTYRGCYHTDCIEPLFSEILTNGQTFRYWDEWEHEIDRTLVDETLSESYVTLRPFKLNGAIEFGFGQTIFPCDYRVEGRRTNHS